MSTTLAEGLEADRLRHRAKRIEQVIAALQDRAIYRNAVLGATPPALERAIADFGLELHGIRRRLGELT